jgi:hypothetical protein
MTATGPSRPPGADALLDLFAHVVRYKRLHEAEAAAAPPPEAPSRADQSLPAEAYLRTGQRPPRGTPRQTRWAVDIKTRIWPGVAAAVKAQYLDAVPWGNYEFALSLMARAGYPLEVAPLLRAALLVWMLDLIDGADAKIWIEKVELYRERPVYVPGEDEHGNPTSVPIESFTAGMSRAEKAVYLFGLEYRPWLVNYLWGHPTPAYWRADLERRGLRHDPTVSDRERRVFEKYTAVGGGAGAAQGPRRCAGGKREGSHAPGSC